jgi:hypothetical protein
MDINHVFEILLQTLLRLHRHRTPSFDSKRRGVIPDPYPAAVLEHGTAKFPALRVLLSVSASECVRESSKETGHSKIHSPSIYESSINPLPDMLILDGRVQAWPGHTHTRRTPRTTANCLLLPALPKTPDA